MKTVNSISGGKTSAKLMIDFPADYNVFQLVRTNEVKFMKGKDEPTRKLISDRIGQEFIGTMEEDEIIYTILDLEQFTGQEIKINTHFKTFEGLIESRGDRLLPSPIRRYCTEILKIEVVFNWWLENFKNEIIEMRIGYRANEMSRMKTMIEKCDNNRILSFKHITGKKEQKNGIINTWSETKFQKPIFPFIEIKPTWKDEIVEFWGDKPVRFAEFNNCVGCFHRDPLLLRYMFDKEPEKMEVFSSFERERKYKGDTLMGGTKDGLTYDKIKGMLKNTRLTKKDLGSCDSGYCGI
jgi:hypothetical protein